MAAPKRKLLEPSHPAPRRTAAEREAAEDRADVEAYDKAIADRKARGNPPGIPWEEAERRLDLLK